jgi:hypothetical protein
MAIPFTGSLIELLFAVYLIIFFIGSIIYVSGGNEDVMLGTIAWGSIITFGLAILGVLYGATSR